MLPPRREYYFVIGMVGVQRAYHSFQRVVKQNRTTSGDSVVLKIRCVGEERLVLANRLPFVIGMETLVSWFFLHFAEGVLGLARMALKAINLHCCIAVAALAKIGRTGVHAVGLLAGVASDASLQAVGS